MRPFEPLQYYGYLSNGKIFRLTLGIFVELPSEKVLANCEGCTALQDE